MSRHQTMREAGSALVIAMLMLVMMGLIGFAALSTVTRDLQVTGAQYRKKASFFAAEAGVAEALQTMRNTGIPGVAAASLSDGATYPHGQPAYALDASVATPIDDLGIGGFPGMNLQVGQNGMPMFQMQMYRINVQGTSTGGGLTRLEIVSGVLSAN
jgi:hypothetical protein